MGAGTSIPRLVKPVAAVMAADSGLIDRAVDWLRGILGETDLESGLYAFDFSDYYTQEMGPGLVKKFFSFAGLREPSLLAGLKRRTAAWERATARGNGARLVNIDPGYWADAKLVLASTKNYSHRIWIGRRVFAEVTLRFHKGELRPLEWTYPDYSDTPALEFFESVRRKYLKQIHPGAN